MKLARPLLAAFVSIFLGGASQPAKVELIDLPKEGHVFTTLKGELRGRTVVTYQLNQPAGRLVRVVIEGSDRFCRFDVLAPEEDKAVFIGSLLGYEFGRRLERGGPWRIIVYSNLWTGCRYRLNVEVS